MPDKILINPEPAEEVEPQNIFHLAMRSRFGELSVGAAVTLYEGPLIISSPAGTASGFGKITFAFVPDVSVQFTMRAAQSSIPPLSLEAGFSLEMAASRWKVTVQILEMSQSWPSGEALISGNLTESLRFGKMKADGSPEPVGRVQFHAVNFHHFHGERLTTLQEGRTKSWRGRTQFEFDRWLVTLDALPDIEERRKHIKAQGGLVVTHIGDLRRKDGKLFDAKKGGELLDFLYWFLSFVNGARCPCILNSGLRYLSYPLWEDWTPSIARSVGSRQSWFANDRPAECMSIADKFHSFWRDEDKRNWLRLAVSIYTESNSNTSGSDLELTKAQIALEMLCWVVLREENAIISEEGLEKLAAADRIRLLLSVCGIPLSIPEALEDLKEAFKTTANADGPLATTEIRNSVVHPTKRNRERLHNYSNLAKFEAWQLNMWYVELVMLKLFGYTGQYDNHLDRISWAGTYEVVPWAALSSK